MSQSANNTNTHNHVSMATPRWSSSMARCHENKDAMLTYHLFYIIYLFIVCVCVSIRDSKLKEIISPYDEIMKTKLCQIQLRFRHHEQISKFKKTQKIPENKYNNFYYNKIYEIRYCKIFSVATNTQHMVATDFFKNTNKSLLPPGVKFMN